MLENEKFMKFRRELKRENLIIIGTPGGGRGIHPWDGMHQCPNCGHYPWMHGKSGDYETGYPYYIHCSKCGARSEQGTIEEVITKWNSGDFIKPK